MPTPELPPWHRLRTTEFARNPYWSAHRDRVRLPDGREHDYHFVRTPGSVIVVPVDGADWGSADVLLVRQYRYLLGTTILELPGGGIKAGQSPEAAARAELHEETGYTARTWQPLGRFNPCKGLLDEICHVYLARNLARDPQPPAGDCTEQTEPVWQAAAELDAAVQGGQVRDGMTLAAWALARAHV